MISAYSRYANSKIVRLIDASHPNDPRPTIIPPAPSLKLFNYTEYEFTWDDRIENVAYRFFNDPNLWWIIADANPEILLWIDIPPGTIIRIPNA